MPTLAAVDQQRDAGKLCAGGSAAGGRASRADRRRGTRHHRRVGFALAALCLAAATLRRRTPSVAHQHQAQAARPAGGQFRYPRPDSGQRPRCCLPATELSNTSIRAVAAAAGVDSALVHHYFGTKEKAVRRGDSHPDRPDGQSSARCVKCRSRNSATRFRRCCCRCGTPRSVLVSSPTLRSILAGLGGQPVSFVHPGRDRGRSGSRVDNPPGSGVIRIAVRRIAAGGRGDGALHRGDGAVRIAAGRADRGHRRAEPAALPHWGFAGRVSRHEPGVLVVADVGRLVDQQHRDAVLDAISTPQPRVVEQLPVASSTSTSGPRSAGQTRMLSRVRRSCRSQHQCASDNSARAAPVSRRNWLASASKYHGVASRLGNPGCPQWADGRTIGGAQRQFRHHMHDVGSQPERHGGEASVRSAAVIVAPGRNVTAATATW